MTDTPSPPSQAPESKNAISYNVKLRPDALSLKPADVMLEDVPITTSIAPLVVRRTNAAAVLRLPDVVNASNVVLPEVIMTQPFKSAFNPQLRFISSASLNENSVAPESGLGFNNMAIAAGWRFSPLFSTGLELGREPFAMNFIGVVNGVRKQYAVNPSLFWGSAFVQFRFDVAGGTEYFVQANGGATSFGLLGKLLSGINYSPTSALRLMFGVEGTELLYNVQNTNYRTPKLGFTYGLSYQF